MSSSGHHIHVALAIHDKDGGYSRHGGAMLRSLFDRARRPVTAHILHDATLTAVNRDRFLSLAADSGHGVRFHDVSDCSLTPLLQTAHATRYTTGAMYRLLMPGLDGLAGVGRVVYLDTDIILTRDIGELWDMDLLGNCLAAAPDIGLHARHPERDERAAQAAAHGLDPDRYFNSGVLVLDLELLRAGDFGTRLAAVLQEMRQSPGKFQFPDQDVLNILFQDRHLSLDLDWNYMLDGMRRASLLPKEGLRHPDALEGKVIHYAGLSAGRIIASETLPYWRAMAATPWAEQAFDAMAYLSSFPDTVRADDFKTLPGRLFKSFCKIRRRGAGGYVFSRLSSVATRLGLLTWMP